LQVPQKTEKKNLPSKHFWCAKSRMRGNETPGRIVTNFCTGVGVCDVITSANFYDCRLWGLSVVGGQILGFSIDSRRRPYNALTFYVIFAVLCAVNSCIIEKNLTV